MSHSSSSKVIFFTFVLLLFIVGCKGDQQSAVGENDLAAPKSHGTMKVSPSPWAIGESVIISFEEVYDSSKWMPGGIDVQLPSPEPNFSKARNFELLWISDRSTFNSKPEKMMVVDGFLKPTHEFEIATERTFSMHGDSIEGFYFREDQPSKILDTVFFENFIPKR